MKKKNRRGRREGKNEGGNTPPFSSVKRKNKGTSEKPKKNENKPQRGVLMEKDLQKFLSPLLYGKESDKPKSMQGNH